MISESRLNELQQPLLEVFNNIENDLLTNIAKRLEFDLDIDENSVTAWQTEKLSQLGALNQENVRTIARKANRIDSEIETAIRKIGFESVNDDEKIYEAAIKQGLLNKIDTTVRQSSAIQNIIQIAIAQAKDKANLTNTTALENTNQEFLNIVNQTFLEVSTGTRDYKSSIRSAIKRLADKGITGQTYDTNRGILRYPIDSAIRREVLTTTLQSAGQMQLARLQEYDLNLVEVTSHVGSRPDHAAWQGKIYAVNGTQGRFRNLADVTGYGEVTGLQGANCRHQFFPYIEGISKKRFEPIPLRQSNKVYKESQMQRYLERQVRKEKRRLIMLDEIGDREGFVAGSVKLKQKELNLRNFKKKTGRTQQNRVEVVGFNRSISQKAVQANKKAVK